MAASKVETSAQVLSCWLYSLSMLWAKQVATLVDQKREGKTRLKLSAQKTDLSWAKELYYKARPVQLKYIYELKQLNV